MKYMMHYVCADIHGNWEKYQAMLTGLPLNPEDKLYILGDAIDRGADGIPILQDIRERGNISFFVGNHEMLMLGCLYCNIEEWMDLWLENGGQKTAEAFLQLSPGEQDLLLDFLYDSYAVMPDLEVGKQHYYLVHAYPDLHYMDRPVLFSEIIEHGDRLWHMVWERVEDKLWQNDKTLRTLRENDRKLLIGHTITTQLCPFNCDAAGRARIHHDKYFTVLDCGCGRADDLACLGVLRLEDGKEFYF